MARTSYAGVSTTDQDLDPQFAKLKAEGCEVIRSEKVSEASREGRAELPHQPFARGRSATRGES